MNNGDYRACCHSEPGIPSDKNLAVPVNFIKDPVKEVWNNNYYRQLRLDLTVFKIQLAQNVGRWSQTENFHLDKKVYLI
jgi:hypothetical protein